MFEDSRLMVHLAHLRYSSDSTGSPSTSIETDAASQEHPGLQTGLGFADRPRVY